MIRRLDPAQRALLECLRDEGEAFALELDSRVRRRTNGACQLGGMVYAVARGLEAHKLVTSREDAQPGTLEAQNSRKRKYFAITDDGRRMLG